MTVLSRNFLKTLEERLGDSHNTFFLQPSLNNYHQHPETNNAPNRLYKLSPKSYLPCSLFVKKSSAYIIPPSSVKKLNICKS